MLPTPVVWNPCYGTGSKAIRCVAFWQAANDHFWQFSEVMDSAADFRLWEWNSEQFYTAEYFVVLYIWELDLGDALSPSYSRRLPLGDTTAKKIPGQK